MDAFFASVEQLDSPELKGKPVIVGGSPEKRGVVAAASYEARRFGVRSAMSAAAARRLCPQGIFVYPRFKRYSELSEQIQQIFKDVTPLVEPLSLDEAYLDVTENNLGEPLARKVAIHIKERIKNEVGLTASAGVGPNKFIAKLASDLRKPDGLVVVPPEKVAEFIADLAVERFWGVGPKTAEKLKALGLHTARDIRARPPDALTAVLGKFGTFLHQLAHGVDERRVETDRPASSCGSETTFERDTLSVYDLEQTLSELALEVSAGLVQLARPARTVTLKVRYSDFKTITRSRTLAIHTDDALTLTQIAHDLLNRSTDAGRRPIRLIGITASHLYDPLTPEQLWLEFMRGVTVPSRNP